MKAPKKEVWFPAKKYGWGWGLPCAWQGWVVFAVWLLLLFAGVKFLAPNHGGLFIAYVVVLGIALFVICLLKGEKPRWRWGKD